MARWSVFVLLLFLPLASAQSEPTAGFVDAGPAPVTLYFHLDGIQDFPINTQEPPAGTDDAAKVGLATNSFSCAGPVNGLGLASTTYHTYHGYMEAGLIDYGHEENGGPRVHRSYGANWAMPLEADGASLHWYMEATPLPGATEMPPAVIPNVVLQSEVRMAPDGFTVDDEDFSNGDLIASGATGPANLSPLLSGHPEVRYEPFQGRHVYHFSVPLELAVDAVPSEGFAVRVHAFVDNPACATADHYAMPNMVLPFTAPEQRPRMEWNVAEQVRFERFEPIVEDGEVRFELDVQSGWGAHDIDPRSIRVDLGDGAWVVDRVSSRVVEHDGARFPVHGATLPQAVEDGWIQARAEAWNLQHTAKAEAYALVHPSGLVVPADGPAAPASLPDTNDVPALPVALALLGLAVLLVRRR